MQAEIRTAERGDVEGLLVLVQAAYRGDAARRGWTHEADLLGGQRTDVEALTESLDDPRQMILVVPGDSGLSGCVLVADKGGGAAHLGMLSVQPDLQAAGLGRRLIAAAEQHAISRFGTRRMAMTVIKQRPELIAYYERRGYAPTGVEAPFPLDDARFGLPTTRDLVFVVLEKVLDPS